MPGRVLVGADEPRTPKRILVGDDERHIVRLVEVNLQRAGYYVVTTMDREAILDLARADPPDLIVIDADWAEHVVPALDNDPLTRHIKVLVLPEDNSGDWFGTLWR